MRHFDVALLSSQSRGRVMAMGEPRRPEALMSGRVLRLEVMYEKPNANHATR